MHESILYTRSLHYTTTTLTVEATTPSPRYAITTPC